MPVAAVAGEPGGVEAQHGAHHSAAQPRHEPLKAGAGHHPAGGTAEIVIDHFDIAETPLPGNCDKIVLAPPAFEIALNLCLGGLANVNHRLARQHGGRQQISARHYHAPRRPCRRLPTAAGQPGKRDPALAGVARVTADALIATAGEAFMSEGRSA